LTKGDGLTCRKKSCHICHAGVCRKTRGQEMAHVLVIEDDRNLRTILREILVEAGHTVIEAGDGSEAMDILPAVAADLVITDILMPEKEGIETIVGLRRCRPGIKIIAMSGGGCVGVSHCLEMAREFGADSSIRKPFNRKEILKAVEDLIGPGQRLCAKREMAFAQATGGQARTLPEKGVLEHVAPQITGADLDGVRWAEVLDPDLLDAKGTQTLSAQTAELHGNRIKQEEQDGQPNIGYWDRADEWVSWKVQFTKPGAFVVSAGCATVHADSEFVVEVAGQQLTGKAPQTNGWADFHVLDLGRIEIEQPGEQVVKVHPRDPNTWKAINLRSIDLTQVDD